MRLQTGREHSASSTRGTASSVSSPKPSLLSGSTTESSTSRETRSGRVAAYAWATTVP